MDRNDVRNAFGTPTLKNATQGSGRRANETVARPNPDGTLGAGAKGSPKSAPDTIPGEVARPGGSTKVTGREAGNPPRAARPGGSQGARGKKS